MCIAQPTVFILDGNFVIIWSIQFPVFQCLIFIINYWWASRFLSLLQLWHSNSRTWLIIYTSEINCIITVTSNSWFKSEETHSGRMLESTSSHQRSGCFIVVVVVQLLSHVWLCDLMDCSKSGFSVFCYFPEFAETHVHWVNDTT